ncbi:protein EPIDERMAL PATTERNING FACTOR 2 [Prunus yedoensis var. nudiflora]|uniref:Protein EPIDERMAL PATTERNING FACTOR 2 n=1 Tax=Prunus yedoensis var. nudiflora TaxID=2094558 RepID=A0A314U6M3_PRUYE|nr:protein EPIDERMAL PATTERNING FACTOR 2 [Prunus yedoensis var. nudiflora]
MKKYLSLGARASFLLGIFFMLIVMGRSLGVRPHLPLNLQAEVVTGNRVNVRMHLEEEFLACCGSTKFAKASPFSSLDEAVNPEVDVDAWIQAFSAHPQIRHSSYSSHSTSAQWNGFQIGNEEGLPSLLCRDQVARLESHGSI